MEEIEYTWDDNGNLLDDGINTYTYDSANRLISLTNGADEYTFTYNGFGDRLQQTINSNTTNYTLDLASGLTQVLYDGDNFYTYGIGRISQLELYGNTPEYFITDALGSVRQLTHESSSVLMTQSYDPYGNVVSSAGSVDSIYGYTGEQTDATGNIYLRARYYNPTDGRFISRDTWSGDMNNPLSLNRWNYVEANPVNYVDFSGQTPCLPSPDHKCPPQWPTNPFSRFDRALDFMYDEMIRNSQGHQASILKEMLNNNIECVTNGYPNSLYPGTPSSQVAGNMLGAYLIFLNLTRQNGR
jgi:RHS repeat-associated protein